MAYVAVDSEGNETIFNEKPTRGLSESGNFKTWETELSSVWLLKGSIEKLIGKKLTWEDEPVELKDNEDEDLGAVDYYIEHREFKDKNISNIEKETILELAKAKVKNRIDFLEKELKE